MWVIKSLNIAHFGRVRICRVWRMEWSSCWDWLRLRLRTIEQQSWDGQEEEEGRRRRRRARGEGQEEQGLKEARWGNSACNYIEPKDSLCFESLNKIWNAFLEVKICVRERMNYSNHRRNGAKFYSRVSLLFIVLKVLLFSCCFFALPSYFKPISFLRNGFLRKWSLSPYSFFPVVFSRYFSIISLVLCVRFANIKRKSKQELYPTGSKQQQNSTCKRSSIRDARHISSVDCWIVALLAVQLIAAATLKFHASPFSHLIWVGTPVSFDSIVAELRISNHLVRCIHIG